MPETITKPDNMEYYEQISALFSEMETIRKEKLKKLIFIEAGFSFMFLITLFANISLWKTNAIYSMSVHVSTVLGIISLVCLVLGVFFASKENQDFVKQLKCVCLGKIIKAFGKISYIETFPFSNSTLTESNLFSVFTNIFPGDMFNGTQDGVKYKIAEAQLRYISGSGKNRRDIQIFKGVLFSFKMNKKIESNTIVATKWDQNIKNNLAGFWVTVAALMLGWYTIFSGHFDAEIFMYTIFGTIFIVAFTILKMKDNIKFSEVHLEDPLFSKKFKVYSENQIEARYLVTTSFMERFLNMTTAFGTRKAKCAFIGDEILFAISTNKNLFEIGNLFSSLTTPKHLSRFRKELSSIISMIDYFKLDEKTGL